MKEMNTTNLKSLNKAILDVASNEVDDRAAVLQEGFLNSLTQKARQVISESEKEEKNEKPDTDDIIKRLAAKALKRAKKKAGRPSGDDAYAGSNPSAAKHDSDMKNPGAIAEVAAPGYEDWASDPDVKASFKKQYGNRWKQVMYGHSWNMKKMDEEVEELEENDGRFTPSSPLKNTKTSRGSLVRGYKARGTHSGGLPGRDRTPTGLARMRRADLEGKTKILTAQERAANTMFKREFSEEASLEEGSYVHSMGQLKKAIRGSKKEIGKAYKKGDKKQMKFWMQNMKDAEDQLKEESLAEGVAAKRMRILRKAVKAGKPFKGEVADFMQRSFKKKFYDDKTKFGGATPAVLGRARLKHAAMKAKGLAEALEQLSEAGYKKLMHLKKSAYAKSLKARTGDPAAQSDFAKTKRAEAEQESKVATRMAMKGGASAEAVKGGGNRRGKRGGFTAKAGMLANKREAGIRNFRNLNVDRGVARDTEIGTVQAMTNRATGTNKPKMTKAQVAKKRESQAKMRDFVNRERSGDFGQNNQEGMRPRYNYLKRTGKLKPR